MGSRSMSATQNDHFLFISGTKLKVLLEIAEKLGHGGVIRSRFPLENM